MKDEIKLKDMIDFLENVYKDIKKQPTLEEELEKERKFINKIKGDNEDEVKEILEGIEVVIKHDGTLEFDTKELKVLLDYITNLQEENEKLKIEWAMVKAALDTSEEKNEKAIKCIKDKYYKEEYERKGTFTNKLMNILQGEDKE